MNCGRVGQQHAGRVPLTAERARELLAYESETGRLLWKVRSAHRVQVGDIAGYVDATSGGYLRVRVDGARYGAHRVVWLLVHGRWPDDGLVIDHVNGNPADNRLCNLRLVTPAVNAQNQRHARRGTISGLLGVRFQRRGGTWVASIKSAGKATHLGNFATAELAHQAYVEAKRRLHEGCTL
jgi:hypothetical protein